MRDKESIEIERVSLKASTRGLGRVGTEQLRSRDACPSAATRLRRVALECSYPYLSIVFGCHPSFYIVLSHLLSLSFTLAAPQTP